MPKFEVLAVILCIFTLIVNRSKDSYLLNEGVVDPNIETTVNTFHIFTLSTLALREINSPAHSINLVLSKMPTIDTSDDQII